jgi:hypothetical protein
MESNVLNQFAAEIRDGGDGSGPVREPDLAFIGQEARGLVSQKKTPADCGGFLEIIRRAPATVSGLSKRY